MATQTTQPNGNGGQVNWNANVGTRFEAVDDPVGSHDGDTTYVSTTVSGQRVSFTFPVFTVPGGSTVNNVTLHAMVRYIGTSSQVRLNLRNEAAGVSEDADQTVTATYTQLSRVFTTNPWTAAAWTVNEVNSDGGTSNRIHEMELRSIAPTTEVLCTQFWMVVDYTAGGAETITVDKWLGLTSQPVRPTRRAVASGFIGIKPV